MAGCCPLPACLWSKGAVTSTLLPVWVTSDRGEEIWEVLKFKETYGGKKTQLRGNRPWKCPAEGRLQCTYLRCRSREAL